MDTLNQAVSNVMAKASQPSRSGVPAKRGATTAPAWFDRETDINMPNKLFSAWAEAGRPREIRRALTVVERGKLEARLAALSDGLIPFSRDQEGLVDAEIGAMFNGFRSMRLDAALTVEVTRRVLREFPLWAIAEGCLSIARRKAVTNPPLNPNFAPNDGQIYEVVAGVVNRYRKTLGTINALLTATVEEPPIVHELRDGIQYPPAKYAAPLGPLDGPPPDGKHAQRVTAELEARRLRREAEQNQG